MLRNFKRFGGGSNKDRFRSTYVEVLIRGIFLHAFSGWVVGHDMTTLGVLKLINELLRIEDEQRTRPRQCAIKGSREGAQNGAGAGAEAKAKVLLALYNPSAAP